MKKNMVLSYDGEKLCALLFFTEQKGISIEDELAQTVEGLYQKYVPANVRTYLDMKQEIQKSKRKTQGSSAVGD